MPDGRLGLLDYGQTKRIPLGVRISFAKLLVALAADERPEVCRLVREEFGGSSRRSDDDVTWRLAAFWIDRDTEDVTGPRNLQEFLDWCEARDPLVTTADDIVMVSRVSMLLRGMVSHLAQI
jgi:aarF domain-containing kinase